MININKPIQDMPSFFLTWGRVPGPFLILKVDLAQEKLPKHLELSANCQAQMLFQNKGGGQMFLIYQPGKHSDPQFLGNCGCF